MDNTKNNSVALSHKECERKMFTIDNSDNIRNRLMKEMKLSCPPYLGPCVDFGTEDVCIEESEGKFKFYFIYRSCKFDYEEFSEVEPAVGKLISFYEKRRLIDNPDQMRRIFSEELGLEKEEVLGKAKVLCKK